MKNFLIISATVVALTLTACQNNKPAQPKEPEKKVYAVDSAFNKTNLGTYKSYDGSKEITLNADGTVQCKNLKYQYTKWGLVQNGDGFADIDLIRPGIDQDITETVRIDTQDHSVVLNNETFRQNALKK